MADEERSRVTTLRVAAAGALMAAFVTAMALTSMLARPPAQSIYGAGDKLRAQASPGVGELSIAGLQSVAPRAVVQPSQAPSRLPPRPAPQATGRPVAQAGPVVTRDDVVTVMHIDYYLVPGAFHIYAMACANDGCSRPIAGVCGEGSLTVTAYGARRANYVLYSGQFSGCTGQQGDGAFPSGVYQGLPSHTEARQPGEQVFFQLTGSWHYQDAAGSVNSAGEIPAGE